MRRPLQRIGFWLFLLSGGMLTYGFDPVTDGMRGIKDLVRKRFPGVPQLSSAELGAWLEDPTRPNPVILDVRKHGEFAVSRLPGARHVVPGARPQDAVSKPATDRPIVVYCSVGYRSAALARRWMANGMTNIYNLEGSLFQWANEGRTLVDDDGRPTRDVHPYARRWGVLLKPQLRAIMNPH